MASLSGAALDWEFEIVHLLSGDHRIERLGEVGAPRRRHEFEQAVAEQFGFLESSRFKAATVRVADEPGCVRYQDHALRVVQDFAVEVALVLQLRLESLELGDIEEHP